MMELYFKNKKTGERIEFPFLKNKADDKDEYDDFSCMASYRWQDNSLYIASCFPDEFELTCDEIEYLKGLHKVTVDAGMGAASVGRALLEENYKLKARIAALEGVIKEVPDTIFPSPFKSFEYLKKSDLLAKHGVTL